MKTNDNELKPIIKWVGGKRQLLPEIMRLAPEKYKTYYEPFLGGGAVLCALKPKRAVVSDANGELINMYQTVKSNAEKLLKLLEDFQNRDGEEFFYETRAMDRQEGFEKADRTLKAARLIYLQKTCYNGVYRVNSRNQYNTPWGKKQGGLICDRKAIGNLHEFLKQNEITIIHADFQGTTATAKEGDFVYFDPPYIPLSDTAAFTQYTAKGFSPADQERLAETFFKLAGKGVKVMLSNSDTELTRKLYRKGNIHTVQANRLLNCKTERRGKTNEVIVTSY